MEKRKDSQIFVLYHKEGEIWDNELYTPKNVFDSIIADWNPVLCELTGIYSVWKDHSKDLKYIGNCQYRRRLYFETDFDFEDTIPEGHILCAEPHRFGVSVREQYAACHNVEDLDLMERIVFENYPEYAEEWYNRIRCGNILFYSQGWVMHSEDFDSYCEWLFGLLGIFCKEAGFESVEDCREYVKKNLREGKYKDIGSEYLNHSAEDIVQYQMRICGYLAERLFTVWAFKNFKNNILCRKYQCQQ